MGMLSKKMAAFKGNRRDGHVIRYQTGSVQESRHLIVIFPAGFGEAIDNTLLR